MKSYEEYFLMNEADVADYVNARLPGFFDESAALSCKEIGDGNLNYVFRVSDDGSGKSIIVKQAGEELRISKKMKISTDRGRIESEILTLQAEYAPGLVPEVYLYDPVMCVICMEDMKGHAMMRTALINHEIFPEFADQITDFLVNTLLFTSDIVMDHKKKEKLTTRFVNPDLCEITHDLVYTEPYNDCRGRNIVEEKNTGFVRAQLYEDRALHTEVAKLKNEFLTNAQSLIHGDLHTGSVFINKDHIYVFDPEFAFFGPGGYDVGNVIANLFFAWCNGDAEITDERERSGFCTYILDTIKNTVDLFIRKFDEAYKANAADIMFKTDDYRTYYLSKLLSDTAGCAGLETIRRTVGMAQVKDVTSIKDEDKRLLAQRRLITLGKKYIMQRDSFKCGQDYLDAIITVIQTTS